MCSYQRRRERGHWWWVQTSHTRTRHRRLCVTLLLMVFFFDHLGWKSCVVRVKRFDASVLDNGRIVSYFPVFLMCL